MIPVGDIDVTTVVRESWVTTVEPELEED